MIKSLIFIRGIYFASVYRINHTLCHPQAMICYVEMKVHHFICTQLLTGEKYCKRNIYIYTINSLIRFHFYYKWQVASRQHLWSNFLYISTKQFKYYTMQVSTKQQIKDMINLWEKHRKILAGNGRSEFKNYPDVASSVTAGTRTRDLSTIVRSRRKRCYYLFMK